MREPKIADGAGKPPPLERLKKRAEFVHAAKGQHFRSRCFNLHAARRPNADDGPPRFGFTVTKRLGNSVVRNRIRRRLKEALRCLPNLSARPAYDYVIVAREPALDWAFPALQEELARALVEVHASKQSRAKFKPPAKSRPAAISAGTAKQTKD